jgi:hypothetical protein
MVDDTIGGCLLPAELPAAGDCSRGLRLWFFKKALLLLGALTKKEIVSLDVKPRPL